MLDGDFANEIHAHEVTVDDGSVDGRHILFPAYKRDGR